MNKLKKNVRHLTSILYKWYRESGFDYAISVLKPVSMFYYTHHERQSGVLIKLSSAISPPLNGSDKDILCSTSNMLDRTRYIDKRRCASPADVHTYIKQHYTNHRERLLMIFCARLFMKRRMYVNIAAKVQETLIETISMWIRYELKGTFSRGNWIPASFWTADGYHFEDIRLSQEGFMYTRNGRRCKCSIGRMLVYLFDAAGLSDVKGDNLVREELHNIIKATVVGCNYKMVHDFNFATAYATKDLSCMDQNSQVCLDFYSAVEGCSILYALKKTPNGSIWYEDETGGYEDHSTYLRSKEGVDRYMVDARALVFDTPDGKVMNPIYARNEVTKQVFIERAYKEFGIAWRLEGRCWIHYDGTLRSLIDYPITLPCYLYSGMEVPYVDNIIYYTGDSITTKSDDIKACLLDDVEDGYLYLCPECGAALSYCTCIRCTECNCVEDDCMCMEFHAPENETTQPLIQWRKKHTNF